jgi:GDPmannose 4,6-dehydratase
MILSPYAAEVLVAVDPQFFRPSEVPLFLGDVTKAEKVLRWKDKRPLKSWLKLWLMRIVRHYKEI